MFWSSDSAPPNVAESIQSSFNEETLNDLTKEFNAEQPLIEDNEKLVQHSYAGNLHLSITTEAIICS